MSNKIKELAGQSLDKVVPYTWTNLNYDELWALQEYFGKLIVKECVNALWTEDCHVSDLAIIDFNEKKRKIYERMGITE
jgi:hypothetical protein